jgi:ACS family tartrate transporter-like MFS transporter
MAAFTPTPEAASGARRIILRLIWPMILLIVLSSLDRVNVSFAQLRMNDALHMSADAYGTGVSLFFVTYLIFQAPCLWLLERIGARIWITVSVVGWGVVAASMAAVHTPGQFYGLRLLLGVFEAGFAPGIAFCCNQWLPRRYLAGAVARTTLAIPASVIIGGPLSTTLMSIANPLGMEGWRFMFLTEGAFTVLMGLLAWLWVIDKPGEAAFLTPGEREAIQRELAVERAAIDAQPRALPIRALLGSLRLWGVAFLWFASLVGSYGMIYWLPAIVKSLSGATDIQVGFLNAIPFIGLGAGMLAGGALADHTGERYLTCAIPSIISGVVMAGAALWGGADWTSLGLLTLAAFFYGMTQGCFWGLPTSFLTGGAVATGIAIVNTIGSSGGLVGPKMFGLMREQTHGFQAPVLAMAALLAAGGIVGVLIKPKDSPVG